MSATDEELENVHDIEMDHVTYVLIMLRYVYLSSMALFSSLELERTFQPRFHYIRFRFGVNQHVGFNGT